MDVLELLKKDHRMVKELFAEVASLAEDDTQNKPVLVVQICQALTVHTQVEEELFYPALYQVHSKDLTVLLDEAAEEHQVAKTLIADLMEIPSHEASFAAKITVLGKYVLSHAKAEEQELFKLAKQHLSQEELGALGEQVEERRSELRQEEETSSRENLEETEEEEVERVEEETLREGAEEAEMEEPEGKRKRSEPRAA
jgi:hemerythrin superfamily protein